MSSTIEPCGSCGLETAAGSQGFVGRRRIEGTGDAADTFLCPGCDERITARHGQRMSDAEVRRVVEGGSLAMIAGLPGAH